MASTTRIVLQGDKMAADRLRLRQGVRVMEEFERLTYFQRLMQNERTIRFDDGSYIHLATRFGDLTAMYYAPVAKRVAQPQRQGSPKKYFYRLPLMSEGGYSAPVTGYALFPLGDFSQAEEVHPDFTDTEVFEPLDVLEAEQDSVDSRYRHLQTGGTYTHLKTYWNNMYPSHPGYFDGNQAITVSGPWEIYFISILTGEQTDILGSGYFYNEVDLTTSASWYLPWRRENDASIHGLGGTCYKNDPAEGYIAVVTEEDFARTEIIVDGGVYGWNERITGILNIFVDGVLIESETQTVSRTSTLSGGDWFVYDRTQSQSSSTDLLTVMPDFTWPLGYLGVSNLDGANHYFYSAFTATQFVVKASSRGPFDSFTFPSSGSWTYSIPYQDGTVEGYKFWKIIEEGAGITIYEPGV